MFRPFRNGASETRFFTRLPLSSSTTIVANPSYGISNEMGTSPFTASARAAASASRAAALSARTWGSNDFARTKSPLRNTFLPPSDEPSTWGCSQYS